MAFCGAMAANSLRRNVFMPPEEGWDRDDTNRFHPKLQDVKGYFKSVKSLSSRLSQQDTQVSDIKVA